MIIHQRIIPGLAINSYIIGDEATGVAAVIDPTRDVEYYVQYAKKNELRIEHILETHVHADFISGSRELKARLKEEAYIWCSGYGGEDWTQDYANEYFRESNKIKLGNVKLGCVHTPGHTPEHISYTLYDITRSEDIPWIAFTGDFLFVGDVGRPDLLGEEEKKELAHQLYDSVFNKIPSLPEFTEIFPAHGAGSLCGKAIGSRRSSTIGYENRFNTSLIKKPEDKWVEDLLDQMPLAPSYFTRMKKVNREGPAVFYPNTLEPRAANPKEVYQNVCEDCLILDVRNKEAFASAHIPKSINIPFGHNLPTWAGWVLPYDRPILIVAENSGDLPQVVTHLTRVGHDDIRGYLDGGINAWEEKGYPLDSLNPVSVHDLHKNLGEKDSITVLDVRTEKEWNSGHIEGAIHIHGGVLQNRISDVPKDNPVAVMCGSGYRGSIAASFLKRAGYEDVSNVIGGMTAWDSAGFDKSIN